MMIECAVIGKVYSGRPGCGCGCRGNYSWSSTSIKRLVNKMNKMPELIEFQDGIYSVETPTRYYWAYTNEYLAKRGPVSTTTGR